MGNLFSVSISADSVVTGCLDCTRPAKYLCELEKNLEALTIASQELKQLRDDVKGKVDIAEAGQMQRLKQVDGWLSRVESLETEVDKLNGDCSQEIQKKCVGGCCPRNCITSYTLGKKFAKKLEEVENLKGKGHFDSVATKPISAPIEERPSQPNVGLQSTFNEVWSYIQDEGVGIIGLYGMGGVGKTTLLTQINSELCNHTPRFDAVIWTVVSKSPNLTKFQDDIGKKIGIHDTTWDQKGQEEKTDSIFRVLKQRKFVLLVDDLWERLDLSTLGIPLPNRQNKCKVVFTTRSEDVCGCMEADKKIKVKILEPKTAWDLFRGKVGEDTLNFHPKISKLAETVAEECKGLPLVLITIGRAMACKKTPQEWEYAKQVLQKSAVEFSGMETNVFALLKFSYDSLENDTIRSCFLYCSLFPEDYSIAKERLIEYWTCEAFLDEFDELNEAENQGHHIMGTLIRACLLEENSRDEVKMHDVIRDMALWIACECRMVKDKVLVQAGDGLEKAPDVGKWKGVERISLMDNDIEKLTETPSCPNLLTLFLNDNNLKMITPGFFSFMPNLRVLDLSRNRYLGWLPVEICALVSLRYLNLSDTEISDLPFDFRNLVELKYLGLDNIRIDKIPEGLLSSFKKLQVLKIDGISGLSETIVEEVECLKDLNRLCIAIDTVSVLSRFLSSPKLPSYTTILSLWSMKGSKYLNLSFLESMCRLSELTIDGWYDLEAMRVERAGEGMANSEIIGHPIFHNLRSIGIVDSHKLKELTWLIFAPNLEVLHIISCGGMEEVISCGKWGGAAEEGGNLNPFAKLTTLKLFDLSNLKSICPNALPFPCLKSIEVFGCRNLKKLPLNSDSAKGCGAVIYGDENWWNGLEWENEATRNAFLQLARLFN
ncbi:hypothetical protein L1049_004685 [Liquidambar formosana]|uniref:NB-ARC domain-containing protein n=1 Tax=Liquidambar formosana TaxID=63359 RepID=A0AAP0RTB8_LIQFO